jgi:hypothetical protein
MGRATWFPKWVVRARVKAIVFKIIGLVLRHSSAHLAASLAHTLLPVTSRRSPTFAAVEYAPVHPMTVHVRHVVGGLELSAVATPSHLALVAASATDSRALGSAMSLVCASA